MNIKRSVPAGRRRGRSRPWRTSTPVSVSVLEYLLGGDASLHRALSLAHLLQPGIDRRAGSQALELGAQEFLHRLTLQSRTCR